MRRGMGAAKGERQGDAAKGARQGDAAKGARRGGAARGARQRGVRARCGVPRRWSSLCADCLAVLRLVARCATRCANFVRCARTSAASQMTKRAEARGHKPSAPQHLPGTPQRALTPLCSQHGSGRLERPDPYLRDQLAANFGFCLSLCGRTSHWGWHSRQLVPGWADFWYASMRPCRVPAAAMRPVQPTVIWPFRRPA